LFEDICNAEARNVDAMRKDVAGTLARLADGVVEGPSLVWTSGDARIELRFYSSYQPVTLFRVNGVVYVRPRIVTPHGAASRFYEIYEASDSQHHYSVQLAHFDSCWRDSSYFVPDTISNGNGI